MSINNTLHLPISQFVGYEWNNKKKNLKINCMENIFTVVKFTMDYTNLSVQYVLFNTTDDRNEIKK